jgi:hypothetical protein
MRALFENLRLSFIVAGLLVEAACGGGGGSTVPAANPSSSAAPSGPTVTLPIHFMTPTTVVYQAGTSGKWTAVTPSGGNVTFTLPVGTTAYSVAFVCPFNGAGTPALRSGPAEVVIEATTADSPTIFCVQGGQTRDIGTVNATLFVEAIGFFPTTNFQLDVNQLTPGYVGGPGFSGAVGGDVAGSPLWFSGSSDVSAIVYNTSASPYVATAGELARNVSFTDNGTVTLDPINPTTSTLSTSTVTLPAGTQNANAYWMPAEGGEIQVTSAYSSPTTLTVPQIPSASAGDYYLVQTTDALGGGFALAQQTSSSIPSSALSLPTTALTYTSASNSGDLPTVNQAYGGWTISGTKYYLMDLSWAETTQAVAAGAPLVNVIASQSYLGSSTTLTLPNLSAVTGMFPNPTGGVSVAVISTNYIASGAVPWENMETGNSYGWYPLPNNVQFQAVMSNYFNYTAP